MVQREKTFTIGGMDCANCARLIETTVSKMSGVSSVEVSLASSKLKVTTDDPKFDFGRVIPTVEGIGYTAKVEETDLTVTLKIEGMDCADESEVIENKLKPLKGLGGLEINLMTQQITVSYSPSLLSIQDIVKAVAETGMRASPVKARVENEKPWWRRNPQIISLLISGFLIVIAFILEFTGSPPISKVVFGLAILIGVYYPAKMGILALKTGSLNIRLLMTIGAAGAILLGLWEEASLLVFVYSLGDVLEAFAVDKARGAIRALMELVPKEALIRRDGSEVTLPTGEIRVNDVAIVKPGEKIPVDGVVVSGSSFVDQSSITGEPVPVSKSQGEEVFAGTINQRGSLEVTVTKLAKDTTLARIIHSVEEAQSKKSSYQRFAERFGRIYTPAMFVLGIAVATIPPLVLGGEWMPFIYRGLVVFVVSCSCGLALSVPVSVVAATANAARKGVLFKGGSYLEAARGIKVVAFDKTGTLTIGRPVVSDIVPYGGLSEGEVLALAGSIESRSEHPLAEAIVRMAKEANAKMTNGVSDFEALTGLGVKAKIGGRLYMVGNDRMLEERGIALGEARDTITRLMNEGKTVSLLSDESRLLGVLAIADKLKAEAHESVSELKTMGVRVVMFTGDNEVTAKAIANQVGVDEYRSHMLPDDKAEAVKRLRGKYGTVAMVGDGINDAQAMATSDVGIAMGAAGTDIAIETGDIVLMSDDLSKVAFSIGLSRRAVSNIQLNTAASLAIVAILVPAAVLGWLPLLPGLLLNEVSALIVIANALRLLR